MRSAEAAAGGVDASPFVLPGNGAAAALCLHGLTGTPYEVRSLGEALSAAGIHAVGPALPGHNETPGKLARTTHVDWLEAARTQLRALRSQHARVFVVGLSMGGLLSLALASLPYDYNMYLYDSNQVLISSSCNSGTSSEGISEFLTSAGTYYAKVEALSGEYSNYDTYRIYYN